MNKFKTKYRKPDLYLSEKAISAIESYTWPGNIREMENVLERAVILADEKEISMQSLHFSPIELSEEETEQLTLEEMEMKMVQNALLRNLGNISKAADELGITRAALYRRIEKFKL